MTSAAPPSAHAAARAIHEAIDAFNARYGTVSMDMDTFRRKNPAATETVADEPLDVVFRDASQAAVPEPAMETPVRRWFETLIRVRNAGGDAGATQAGASGAAPFGPGLRAGGRIYAG